MKKWRVVLGALGIVLVAWGLGYAVYKKGFESGRDFSAQRDSESPKKWVSEKWDYEITFPRLWESIKRDDPSIRSMGADVFCSGGRGASTAVFVYPRVSRDTLDGATDEILNLYRNQVGEVTLVEKNDFTKDGFPARTLVFKQGEFTHHYTFVLTDKVNLSVSSNCPTSEYESSIADFQSILDSLKFL